MKHKNGLPRSPHLTSKIASCLLGTPGALRSAQTSCKCDPVEELRVRRPPLGETPTRLGGRRRTAMHCPAPGAAGQQALGLCLCLIKGVPCAPLHSPGESDQPRKARVHDSDQMLPVKHRCMHTSHEKTQNLFPIYSCRIFKQISLNFFLQLLQTKETNGDDWVKGSVNTEAIIINHSS